MGQRNNVFMRLISQLKKVLSRRTIAGYIVNSRKVVRTGTAVSHVESKCFLCRRFIKILSIKMMSVWVIFAISYLPTVVPGLSWWSFLLTNWLRFPIASNNAKAWLLITHRALDAYVGRMVLTFFRLKLNIFLRWLLLGFNFFRNVFVTHLT